MGAKSGVIITVEIGGTEREATIGFLDYMDSRTVAEVYPATNPLEAKSSRVTSPKRGLALSMIGGLFLGLMMAAALKRTRRC